MPKIPDEILDLEKRFWTEGPDFYLQNLDEKCLTVFADAAGLWTAEEIAKTVKSSGRWTDVQIDPKGVHYPSPDVVLLSYEGSATGEGGKPYRALVSSGYVHRDEGWKLTFHTQATLD